MNDYLDTYMFSDGGSKYRTNTNDPAQAVALLAELRGVYERYVVMRTPSNKYFLWDSETQQEWHYANLKDLAKHYFNASRSSAKK
jgi:hypothetical protein